MMQLKSCKCGLIPSLITNSKCGGYYVYCAGCGQRADFECYSNRAIDNWNNKSKAVTLMTLHSAKRRRIYDR